MCRAKHRVLPAVVFLGLAVLQLSVTAHARAGQPAANVDYNFQIRPLLADRCYACHGPDAKQRKADLRLDTPTGARDAGVIVPGKPAESEVVRRITATDRTHMPPRKSNLTLSRKEIELIRQ
jgi:mono/diheme cytochrome c family protein